MLLVNDKEEKSNIIIFLITSFTYIIWVFIPFFQKIRMEHLYLIIYILNHDY